MFISSYKIHKTPWLLTEYAKLDFDNTLFLRRHNSFLNEKAAYNDILNLSEREFRNECERIFKHNISNTIIRYGQLNYNSLSSININILRKFFTKIIVDIYLKDGLGISITNKQKESLFKLWGEYPYIITKSKKQKSGHKKKYSKNIQTDASEYDLDISRARMMYAYNEIMHFSRNNYNPSELSTNIPDIMDISFESSSSYPRTTIINLRDPNTLESNFDPVIRPPITFRIEGNNNNTNPTNTNNQFSFRSYFQRSRTFHDEIPEVLQEDSDQLMSDY